MAKTQPTSQAKRIASTVQRRSLVPSRTARWRANSFFAGIGGFDLGFSRAGFESAFHCEKDSFCASVLRRHWRETPCFPDVSLLQAADIPDADVWCGGFPCQDVSVARGWLGRDGLGGKNTGLFYPFLNLVRARLPLVVLMENVTGLLSAHQGRDFAFILQSFHDAGYGVAWRILNTRYFGAPQSRPRVYICAWRQSAQKAFDVLFEEGATVHPESQRLGFLRETKCAKTGASVPEVAFCLAATSGRHTGTDWSRSYVAYTKQVRRLTPTECERLQGFPTGWTLPSDDFHSSDDEIDTLRYHAIGNAVSVPVVEWVAERIGTKLAAKEREPVGKKDPWADLHYALDRVPDFGFRRASKIELPKIFNRDNAPPIKWMSGGISSDRFTLFAPVSAAPERKRRSSFVQILDDDKPASRYFLSANAAAGILRRVASQGRELYKPLDKALRQLEKTA
jgi:DNA (cytosine-5)-methyltransferase 1